MKNLYFKCLSNSLKRIDKSLGFLESDNEEDNKKDIQQIRENFEEVKNNLGRIEKVVRNSQKGCSN